MRTHWFTSGLIFYLVEPVTMAGWHGIALRMRSKIFIIADPLKSEQLRCVFMSGGLDEIQTELVSLGWHQKIKHSKCPHLHWPWWGHLLSPLLTWQRNGNCCQNVIRCSIISCIRILWHCLRYPAILLLASQWLLTLHVLPSVQHVFHSKNSSFIIFWRLEV